MKQEITRQPPFDSRLLQESIRRGVEAGYKETHKQISEIRRQVSAINRAERASVSSVPDTDHFPPKSVGATAFVLSEENWYYCDGVNWIPLDYGGGGAGAGGRPYSTIVVAASNSVAIDHHRADYVCDGINDEVEISAAIGQLRGLGRGKVLLLEGVFTISNPILLSVDYVTLEGMGKRGTHILCADDFPADMPMINAHNPDNEEDRDLPGAVYNVTIQELVLDACYTASYCIADATTPWPGEDYDPMSGGMFLGWNLHHVHFADSNLDCIRAWNIFNFRISDCMFSAERYCLYSADEFDYNTISNNSFEYEVGIFFGNGVYNTIVGNVFECTVGVASYDPANADWYPGRYGPYDFIISSNVFECDFAVELRDATGQFIIAGNTFYYLGRGNPFLKLYNCADITVTGNHFNGDYSVGAIVVDRSDDITIIGNHFNFFMAPAITVDRTCKRVSVQDNRFIDCGIGGHYYTSAWAEPETEVVVPQSAAVLINTLSEGSVTSNTFAYSGVASIPKKHDQPLYAVDVAVDSANVSVAFNDMRGYGSEGPFRNLSGGGISKWNIPEGDLVDPDSKIIILNRNGPLSVGPVGMRFYLPWPCTIESASVSVGSAPSGVPCILDINLDGSSIFLDQNDRPEIAIGENVAETFLPNPLSALADQYLTVDIDQDGGAADLNIQIRVMV